MSLLFCAVYGSKILHVPNVQLKIAKIQNLHIYRILHLLFKNYFTFTYSVILLLLFINLLGRLVSVKKLIKPTSKIINKLTSI